MNTIICILVTSAPNGMLKSRLSNGSQCTNKYRHSRDSTPAHLFVDVNSSELADVKTLSISCVGTAVR